jgi:hypothetical protein
VLQGHPAIRTVAKLALPQNAHQFTKSKWFYYYLLHVAVSLPAAFAKKKKKKIRGFGPLANYADRATAAS